MAFYASAGFLARFFQAAQAIFLLVSYMPLVIMDAAVDAYAEQGRVETLLALLRLLGSGFLVSYMPLAAY
jgi:hypothetical protein